MELKGKKVLLIGLARTGRECARFLARQGAQVAISDLRGAAELGDEIAALRGLPLTYRLGGEETSWLDGIVFLGATRNKKTGRSYQNPMGHSC